MKARPQLTCKCFLVLLYHRKTCWIKYRLLAYDGYYYFDVNCYMSMVTVIYYLPLWGICDLLAAYMLVHIKRAFFFYLDR